MVWLLLIRMGIVESCHSVRHSCSNCFMWHWRLVGWAGDCAWRQNQREQYWDCCWSLSCCCGVQSWGWLEQHDAVCWLPWWWVTCWMWKKSPDHHCREDGNLWGLCLAVAVGGWGPIHLDDAPVQFANICCVTQWLSTSGCHLGCWNWCCLNWCMSGMHREKDCWDESWGWLVVCCIWYRQCIVEILVVLCCLD